MNTGSLRQKLLLLTLLPSALISTCVALFFTYQDVLSLEEEMQRRGTAMVNYLAPASEYAVLAGHMESLQALVQAANQQNSVRSVLIVGSDKRTLAISGKLGYPAHLLSAPLKGAAQVPTYGDSLLFAAPIQVTRVAQDDLFDAALSARQPSSNDTIGQVWIELDKTDLNQHRIALIERGIGIIFVGLLLTALFASRIAHTVSQPILQLVVAIRAMREGKPAIRVQETSQGELGELEKGFNQMTTAITESQHTLQTRIQEATAQLAYQATHDHLTGLVNRREFESRVQEAFALALAGNVTYSLLLLDLDHFKQVNDQAGHPAGDALLRQLARLFRNHLRATDTIARLGGDEFGVLLPGCSQEQARHIGEELLKQIQDYRFNWQGKLYRVGVSIGLVEMGSHFRDMSALVAACDSSCYTAKAEGRGRISIYQPPSENEPNQALAGEMAINLLSDRLEYQLRPVIPLSGQATSAFYEFCPMIKNGQERASLGAYADMVERYDMSASLDMHILQAATLAIAERRNAKPMETLRCLIPLSVTALRTPESLAHIQATLAAQQIPCSCICLLFAETAASYDLEQTRLFIQSAQALGLKVAIDEFGGWHISFNEIQALRPDFLRIHRALTRNAASSRSDMAITKAVCEVAHDMQMQSIADDVHELANLHLLRECGVTFATGDAAGPLIELRAWTSGRM